MAATGEYMVGATIGEGAFSQVFHAKHKGSGRDVAIKVIEKVALKKNPQVERVWRERNILQQLNGSKHVINLWASFHDAECCYFVMECCLGGDLNHVIQEAMKELSTSPLGSSSSWYKSIPHYGLQIVKAIQYIHSYRIIHCDLKPENILCKPNGHIQLADFGCAVQLSDSIMEEQPGEGQSASGPINQDDKMALRGTADYACPELLNGTQERTLTFAVDMWSFGCILYALWYGQSPFHALSDFLAVEGIINYAAKSDTSEACRMIFPDLDSDLRQGSSSSPIEGSRSQTHNPTAEWKQLICSLLIANPAKRLGSTQESLASLLEAPVWKGVDLTQDPSFAPPNPPWFRNSMINPMRDGNQGWVAFLV